MTLVKKVAKKKQKTQKQTSQDPANGYGKRGRANISFAFLQLCCANLPQALRSLGLLHWPTVMPSTRRLINLIIPMSLSYSLQPFCSAPPKACASAASYRLWRSGRRPYFPSSNGTPVDKRMTIHITRPPIHSGSAWIHSALSHVPPSLALLPRSVVVLCHWS